MARIELAPQIVDDFDRIVDYLVQHQVANAAARIDEIIQAIGVLESSPLIGKPTGKNKRELVVGRRSHGYVVLYQYLERAEIVLVLAVRSQREAGYART